eukprot:TRINITY_DN9908_c0_g1_i1.p1 TRINITY_DN9908_c0_g1~~TRINITY_DN9908_c0_g1_i1.p1  ORF type:complete len:398 (-),score=67.16 TRINITY_DN9908_c0_g1_i1:536-1729(-)
MKALRSILVFILLVFLLLIAWLVFGGWFAVIVPKTRPVVSVQASIPAPGAASCSAFTNTSFYDQIDKDLADFVNGIAIHDIDDAVEYCSRSTSCMRVQIIGGLVYIVGEQPSCQNTLLAIKQMLLQVSTLFAPLPDADFVLSTLDGTVQQLPPELLFFAISKPTQQASKRLLFPDWSYWSYPGVKLTYYPVQMASMRAGRGLFPWTKRLAQLFWRGVVRGIPNRASLVIAAAESPELINAQDAWATQQRIVPLEDHCQYKYLAYTPGITHSVRLKYLLACGSVVVLPNSEDYMEWFHHLLAHGVNMWRVPDGDHAFHNVAREVQMLIQNDELAHRIGKAGAEIADKYLTMEAVLCYWAELVRRYSQRLRFRVVRAENAVLLQDSLMPPWNLEQRCTT